MMNLRKYLLIEQTIRDTPPEGFTHTKLPDNQQTGILPTYLIRKEGCELVIHSDGVRYKECPKPTTNVTNPLNEYVGEYKKGITHTAKFSIDGIKLSLNFNYVGPYQLLPLENTPDVFLDDVNKIRATFFRDGAGKVSEVKIDFEGANLARIFGTSNYLKKETGSTGTGGSSGTGGIDIGGGQNYDLTGDFGCIERTRKRLNRYKLEDSVDADGTKHKDEDLLELVDGVATELQYFPEPSRKVLWIKKDGTKEIVEKGKWECYDTGYAIIWDDGEVSYFGISSLKGGLPAGTGGQSGNLENNQEGQQQSESCSSYTKSCPTEEEILQGKKLLKMCVKCDLVKDLQDSPGLKTIIFEIQKSLGKKQKTDDSFGPIMKQAVIEFQGQRGVPQTGNVGKLTLTELRKVVDTTSNSLEPNTQKKLEPNIEPKVVDDKKTQKTQVKQPIKRTTLPVLDPNEDL